MLVYIQCVTGDIWKMRVFVVLCTCNGFCTNEWHWKAECFEKDAAAYLFFSQTFNMFA
ncbi:hypothetical protein EXN66_Car020623 [Channa argus]|uniref:Uncharacterized protein n=1 Tax=Channa argus TaxID=215402 RepID=A0A6G1QQQ7_CHAAH|nr:hypothetical protein EXN66_Car020623 [Channa argus]